MVCTDTTRCSSDNAPSIVGRQHSLHGRSCPQRRAGQATVERVKWLVVGRHARNISDRRRLIRPIIRRTLSAQHEFSTGMQPCTGGPRRRLRPLQVMPCMLALPPIGCTPSAVRTAPCAGQWMSVAQCKLVQRSCRPEHSRLGFVSVDCFNATFCPLWSLKAFDVSTGTILWSTMGIIPGAAGGGCSSPVLCRRTARRSSLVRSTRPACLRSPPPTGRCSDPSPPATSGQRLDPLVY
jgi:hypothetical protein